MKLLFMVLLLVLTSLSASKTEEPSIQFDLDGILQCISNIGTASIELIDALKQMKRGDVSHLIPNKEGIISKGISIYKQCFIGASRAYDSPLETNILINNRRANRLSESARLEECKSSCKWMDNHTDECITKCLLKHFRVTQ